MATKRSKKAILEKEKLEKKKQEDAAFYKMLVAFGIALILEFTVVTFYRQYYAGANYRPVFRIIMWCCLGISAAALIAFVTQLAIRKFKHLRGLLAVGIGSFGLALALRLVNTSGLIALKVGCIVCPIILLLYVIYLIYQAEFFITALAGSLVIFSVWMAKRSPYIDGFKRFEVMAGAAVFIVLLLIVTLLTRKSNGVIGKGKWMVRVFPPKTSYTALYITYGFSLLLFGVYLLLEQTAAASYIVIITNSAYLFISAIYHTVKLM